MLVADHLVCIQNSEFFWFWWLLSNHSIFCYGCFNNGCVAKTKTKMPTKENTKQKQNRTTLKTNRSALLSSLQTLAIYDRFGRLMYGQEDVPKDVLEYVVFEKHLTNPYGSWRMHGKIIPSWAPPKQPILKVR